MSERIVLYDAECGFCRWSVGQLLAWDRGKRLRVVALQEPDAAVLLPGMSEEARMASWHLVDPSERVAYSAGDAFPPLLRAMPAGRPLAFLTAGFPGLTGRAYEWATRHRGALGRLVSGRALDRADSRIRERTAELAYDPDPVRPLLAIV